MLTIEIKRETPYRFIRWLTIGNIAHKYRGTAITSWYGNGQKYVEVYQINGKRHRNPSEGPAIIYWHPDGQKWFEKYWTDGKLAR